MIKKFRVIIEIKTADNKKNEFMDINFNESFLIFFSINS